MSLSVPVCPGRNDGRPCPIIQLVSSAGFVDIVVASFDLYEF